MNRRDIRFAVKDRGLRDDVHILGALVGEVIHEQGGAELFARVEAIRRAAIARREGKPRAAMRLSGQLTGLPATQAEDLVRAFAAYFQVVNLAERVHRIRRRREYERRGSSPQPGGLADALRQLHAAGLSAAELPALLDQLAIEPVFTAHPTEATRRTLLEKQQNIARALIARLDSGRTPRENAAALAKVRTEITTSWQTEEHPAARMTVADEREHVLFYLTDVLYRTLPIFYETLAAAIGAVYGAPTAMDLPLCIRFGSWVGGDMDGNPAVTAATVRETLAEHRAMIVARYSVELSALQRKLSQSETRVSCSTALRQRLDVYAARLPAVAAVIPSRHHDMPYRQLLMFIQARLQATLQEGAEQYVSSAELQDDLKLISRSLQENNGLHAGAFAVHRLRRRVATFGLHLAALDIRQDALVHRRVVGQLLAEPEWATQGAAWRAGRIRRALQNRTTAAAPADEQTQAVLDVFAAMAEGRQRYGAAAVGTYIISMAQHTEDVLAVLLLARCGGLATADDVPLDIAPLFETVDDLRAAAATMQDLFADPDYRRHLARRGNVQTVMVGYSDSNKDGGLAAARWAVQRAQEELVAVADAAGIRLIIFHGRGGTTSRGGGPAHRAVLAAPPGAVRGRLRLTEQGEIINAKYGLRALALRSLEQMGAAVLLATYREPTAAAPAANWRTAMDTLAQTSRQAFRELVYETPDFVEYFRQITPIDVIERMKIGSRPPARRAQSGIGNLRAIPWVFAWTQNRALITGWYGLGAGLRAVREQHGMAVLRAMLDWPFFANLLDDAEMVLAKTDLAIAAQYVRLTAAGLRQHSTTIEQAYTDTVSELLALRDADRLLAHDPVLARSIQLRNPYVDPMSLLQVDLLARWRQTERRDEALLSALFATVNGIAQGLQNTG